MKTIILTIIYVWLFGTIFIISRKIIPPLNTISYIALRSLIGAATIFVFMLLRRQKRCWFDLKTMLTSDWRRLLIFTLLFHAGSLLLVFWATPYTTAGNQAVLNSFFSPLTVVVNLLFFRAQPSRKIVIAVIISTIGVLLVIYPWSFTANRLLFGNLLVLAGMVLGAFDNIFYNKMSKLYDATALTFILSLLPGLFLLPFIFISGQGAAICNLTLNEWLLLLYLGVGVNAVGYGAVSLLYAQPLMTAEKFAVLSGIVFVTGFLAGITICGERYHTVNVLGVILVIMAVVFINFRGRADKSSILRVKIIKGE